MRKLPCVSLVCPPPPCHGTILTESAESYPAQSRCSVALPVEHRSYSIRVRVGRRRLARTCLEPHGPFSPAACEVKRITLACDNHPCGSDQLDGWAKSYEVGQIVRNSLPAKEWGGDCRSATPLRRTRSFGRGASLQYAPSSTAHLGGSHSMAAGAAPRPLTQLQIVTVRR
jgi:hypothetical protein